MRHGSTPRTICARPSRPTLMLAVYLALTPALAASGSEPYLPDARLGTRTAPILLLSRPDIQRDLDLTPEQVAGAVEMIRSLHARADALRGKPDAPEVVSARRAIDQAQTEWVQTRLSVEQQSRLAQIDLQWEGPSALLTRPLVSEALGLDDSQRRALAQAVAHSHRLASQGEPRSVAVRQLAESALSILNDDQRARWQALLGRPFIVEQSTMSDPAVQTTGGTR